MMRASFTFFCDANANMGLGHYSRCKRIGLALSELFKSDCSIEFVGDIKGSIVSNIADLGWIFHACLNNEFISTDAADRIAIIDSYTISNTVLKSINRNYFATVFIDDFNNHDFSSTDLVVNFRFGFDTSIYTVKRGCYGLKYFPASHDMATAREKKCAIFRRRLYSPPSKILIYLGSLDEQKKKLLIEIIDQAVAGVDLNLLTGLSSKEIDINLKNNSLSLTPLSTSIADAIYNADAVISSGGLMKYEAGFCMTPNASINQNRGQQDDTNLLAKENLTYDLGSQQELETNACKIKKKIVSFLSSNEQLRQKYSMTRNYDTQSTNNVAREIVSLLP